MGSLRREKGAGVGDIKEEFHAAMLGLCARALSDHSVKLNGLKRMILNRGGYETALVLLKSKEATDGYLDLLEVNAANLTVEALVLDPRWNTLFSDEERSLARVRLGPAVVAKLGIT